jgi:hypothetical protein
MLTTEVAKPKTDRRRFLTNAAITVAGVAGASIIAGCGGGSSPAASSGSSSSSGGGVSVGSSEIAEAFRSIKTDEDNHVTFLVQQLGSNARPAPTFSTAALTAANFNTFVADSAALENTGTGAYLGAAPYLASNTTFLGYAAAIAIVEGRHAGFLNALNGSITGSLRPLLTDPGSGDSTEPNNDSLEVPQTPDGVNSRAAPFLVGVNLNGGPAPLTGSSFAPYSAIQILNYALLLEYLEKTFYDINVPTFFP